MEVDKNPEYSLPFLMAPPYMLLIEPSLLPQAWPSANLDQYIAPPSSHSHEAKHVLSKGWDASLFWVLKK